MEQKNKTQAPQSAFHIPPTNQKIITQLKEKFEKLKRSNNKITDELFFELATHLRFHYEALLNHPYIQSKPRLTNQIFNKLSETDIQTNIYLLLNKHNNDPTEFNFLITDIDRFANYMQNIINKKYLPSETVETDGEDYLLPTLRQRSEQEAQEDQDRHRQPLTNEDFVNGLVFGPPDMGGGKKKRKTRRKRKKRKTKKRRKNKRKTKKRRKTKRRKTKRRKK